MWGLGRTGWTRSSNPALNPGPPSRLPSPISSLPFFLPSGPPVPFARQVHDRWNQHHPDDRRVEQHRIRQPKAEELHRQHSGKGEDPEDQDHNQCRRSDGGRRRGESLLGCLIVLPAAVEGLFHPGQQEDFVVHAESEHHREYQHRYHHEDGRGGAVQPYSFPPTPYWNTSVISPNVALTERVFMITALIGTSTDLKAMASMTPVQARIRNTSIGN